MNRWSWVVSVFLVGCSARVTGGLDEERANEAVAWLASHGVAASKASETGAGEARYSIEVPRAEVGEALALLEDANLPRRDDPGIAETYAETSLVPSPTEERVRFLSAVAGELSRTIERIDGVVDARVHIASPENVLRAIDEPPPPARASALVTIRPGTHVERESIRELIAGAVDGLVRDQVSVVVVARASLADRRSPYAHLGPFRVSPSSLRPLGALLTLSIALHVALAAAVLALLRRRIPGRFPTPVEDR